VKSAQEISYDDLDSAAVVVLNETGSMSRQLESFLTGRASAGKVIVFALDTRDENVGESATIFARLARLKKPLSITTGTAPVAVVLPDTISEIWRGFPSIVTREAAVYRYGEGLPGTVLLRLDNGVPLATQLMDADGRVWVLVATPLGVTRANNLCETGFYVPALDRLARTAAASVARSAQVWTAGTLQRNRFYARGKAARVLDAEGAEIDRWQSQPGVVFKLPGVYTVVPDGEAGFPVTVVADPEESELDYRTPAAAAVPGSMVMSVGERRLKESLRAGGGFQSHGLWLLLALFLLAEVLFWPRERGMVK
jgi:hypothetical protein